MTNFDFTFHILFVYGSLEKQIKWGVCFVDVHRFFTMFRMTQSVKGNRKARYGAKIKRRWKSQFLFQQRKAVILWC